MTNGSASQTIPWSSECAKLQEEYLKLFKKLEGDSQGRLDAQNYLQNAELARCHGIGINMGYLPKLYDNAALEAFDAIVKTTYTILDKVTKHYIEDASYRKLFQFSPLLEQLILVPTPYDCTIPIGRFDIFLDEHTGDFKFCEFNTDGTSAMGEDFEVANALATTPLLEQFTKTHSVHAQELHNTWVETFMNIYNTSKNALPAPVVALVDYVENASLEEQLDFRSKFEEQGVVCLVADIPTLEYKDGALFARDVSDAHPAHMFPTRIDVIYRRVVTYELLEELEKTPTEALAVLQGKMPEGKTSLTGALALLKAVVDQSVCMLGGFNTQVAHSKAIFCMLHHQETMAFLSPSEQDFVKKHVPFTTWLKAEFIDIELVKQNKDKWIIKPVDGYMSKDVEAGKTMDTTSWHALIDQCVKEDFIVQEYCPQYQTLNTLPVPLGEDGSPLFSTIEEMDQCLEQGAFDPMSLVPINILTGLYSYGAAFGGCYIRAGQDAVIVGYRDGVTLAALLVDAAKYSQDAPAWSERALRPRQLAL